VKIRIISLELASFLDEFRKAGRDEKRKMAAKPRFHLRDKVHRAYYAAMVESLCLESRLKIPTWVNDRRCFLHDPAFAGGLESLKAVLLVESPLPFRRRNIFVSENALSRA